MLVVPKDLHYTYGATTRVRAVRDHGAEADLVPQAPAGRPAGPGLVWGGSPARAKGSAAPSRPSGSPIATAASSAVFIFAVLFGIFWKGGLALLPSPPRHRRGHRRLRHAASVHDHLDAGKLHPPALQAAMVLTWSSSVVLCRPAQTTRRRERRRGPGPEAAGGRGRAAGGRIYSWSAPRRPGPRPCTTSWPGTRRSTCRR